LGKQVDHVVELRDDDAFAGNAALLQAAAHGLQRRFLAVSEENRRLHRQASVEPGEQLVAVRVPGIDVDLADRRVHAHVLALDLHRRNAALQQGTQRARRLVADQQHGGVAAPEVLLQVMADAPGVAHAAAGHDDGAAGETRDDLAFLHRLGEADVGPAEQVRHLRGVLQQVGVLQEYLGRLDGERRVEEHRHFGQFAAVEEDREVEQQFLRALHGEDRDQQVAAALQRRLHLVGENLAPLFRRHVAALAAAVGRLAADEIEIFGGFRVRMEQLVIGADVAGKQQAQDARAALAGGDLHLDGGGTEDMPGIPEACPHALPDLAPGLVGDVGERLQRRVDVVAGIHRLDRRAAALHVAAVQPLDLGLLDVGAVGQHVGQQVEAALGSEDRSLEALLHQLGDEARVIDVGMGQQDEVDLGRIEGKGAVVQFLQGLGALEHAAVDKELAALGLHPVAGAGDRAGRPAETQQHVAILKRESTRVWLSPIAPPSQNKPAAFTRR